jgi:hypothetical protein
MLHLLLTVKKGLDVCEPGRQTNTWHFCCSVLLPSSLHPSPPTQGGKVGGYNISCSDIRYFQLRYSVNTLPHFSYILAPTFGLAYIIMNYLYKTAFL